MAAEQGVGLMLVGVVVYGIVLYGNKEVWYIYRMVFMVERRAGSMVAL